MGRYPTVNGVAISPYELGFTRPTPEQILVPRRVEYHHAHYYNRYYNQESDGYGVWRQTFRNLMTNLYPMLTEEHNGAPKTLHRLYDPPKMPTDTQMIDHCNRMIEEDGFLMISRRSNPPKIITPDQWRAETQRYTNRRSRR